MTVVAHTYAGAVCATAVCQVIGVDAGMAAPAAGGFLGSVPDSIPWIGARLGLWDEGVARRWFHDGLAGMLLAIVLVVPFVSHWLPDKLIHAPLLPDSANLSPGNAYAVVVGTIFGKKITRRDIHWLTAEVALWLVSINVHQLVCR